MVLGILIAAMVAPGLLGSQEAIRQGQSKDRREEHRARRCNLIATCIQSSPRNREIDGRPIVLRNGKLWIDTTTGEGEPFGHTFAGYYLPYPDTNYEGLVTTITDVAPIMNWVYIDRETYEAKYGVRADAQPNFTGPFDCTRQDRRLTFDSWEGWCAVEEHEGYWCLYYDVDDDGLRSKVAPGTRVLEIELRRKEKRFKKEEKVRQQDQTTNRAVDTTKEAPVDRLLLSTPDVKRPGVFNRPPSEPETMAVENNMSKTPTPAYSKSDKDSSPPNPQSPKNGAVVALDDILAMEVRAAAAPVSIVPQQSTPYKEGRTAPKLNRNSGSKTIAQAQMFEAMAATQMRNDNATRRTSDSKRASLVSSNADSSSVYSEDDQKISREIWAQPSVSQRVYSQVPVASPVPITPWQPPHIEENPRKDSQQFLSSTYQEETPPADPAVFSAPVPSNSKRRSPIISSSQRKRSSRIFTARRPGKHVSPRSSARKSLTDTMSSGPGRKISSGTNRAPKPQSNGDRTQGGRKTTSTFLRDIDNLLSQDVVKARSTPSPGKGSPLRGERRGGMKGPLSVLSGARRS